MRGFLPALLLALLALPAVALPPALLDFQGRLFHVNGSEVNGSLSVTFRIYNASIGGSAIWTETQSIQMQNGYFDALLGGVSSLTVVPLDQRLYLGIEAGGVEMAPRLNFTHSPFALSLGGVVNVNGSKAGVGTTNPQGLLDVKSRLRVFDNTSSSNPNDMILIGGGDADIELYGTNGRDGYGTSIQNLAFYDARYHTFRAADATNATLFINATNQRVGIRTTSPTHALHVVGNTNVSGTVYVSEGGEVYFLPTGLYQQGILRQANDDIMLAGSMATNDWWRIYGSTAGVDQGSLIIMTGDNGTEPIIFYQNDSNGGNPAQERLRIHSNGNVGIHNSNPTSTLYVSGTFTATGTKSAEVETADYGSRKLYSMESAEVRFYDEGRARLSGGSATVKLDPIFTETIEGPLNVHLTSYGKARLYVESTGLDYFVVKSIGGDDADFSWMVSATRKGFAGCRLEQPG